MSRSWNSELPTWGEVAKQHHFDTILIGNGFSINLWDGYKYESLFDQSRADLESQALAIFEAVGTTNFEAVLERLAQVRDVLEAARRRIAWVDEEYMSIREALFTAVAGTHLPWLRLEDSTARQIVEELNTYGAAYTTNYDLNIYWSHMRALPSVNIKDFLWNEGKFNPEDTKIWRADATALYYLHGALHLWQDVKTGVAGKWTTSDGQPILSRIEEYQAESNRQPLFVSEGTSHDKMRAIRRSDYLSFAYNSLEADSRNTVLFGANLGPGDDHILKALSVGERRVIAVSVYPGQTEEDIVRIKVNLSEKLHDHDVLFFDSSTHPLGDSGLTVKHAVRPLS